MKKNSILTLAFAATLSLFASCAKEDSNPVEGQGKQITISAAFPENATKVVFVGSNEKDPVELKWEAGDQITVTATDNPTNTQTFTIASGVGTKQATFTGTALAAAASYKITYGTAGTYAEQTQAADGDASHVKYVATLSGVTDYTNFTFSKTWATDNGATYTPSSVLRLRAQIPNSDPNDFFGKIKAVVFKASAPIFAGSNELKVNITNSTDDAELDYLTIYATLPGEQEIAAGTTLLVGFQMDADKAYKKYTAYREFKTDMTIKAGQVNTIAIDCMNIFVSAGKDDDGTAAHPYLIADQIQLDSLHRHLVSEQITYIKLVDDIDMTGIDWEPLNYAAPYKMYVNFDGQNHTISNLTVGKGTRSDNYPSLFGVLYGTCKNLTIDKADIKVKSSYKSGILAGYLGTADAFITCEIKNVTIKNSSIGSDGTSTRSMGAFVGQVPMADVTFDNCHVLNTTVTQLNTSSSNHAGGFVGYSQQNAKYTDCTTEATVNAKQFAGGFVGYGGKGTFTRCYASGSVSGTKDVGGFAGKTEDPSFIDCKYTGAKITASDNSKNAHVGGFVGYAYKAAAAAGDFAGCYVDGSEIDGSAGCQRVGGFVGQVDAGNKFTKCYVKGISMTSALNSGGFVGVAYNGPTTDFPEAGYYKCYVDGGTITARGNNLGGFVAYPQKVKIENCYTTATIVGGAYANIGGFIGQCQDLNTIQNCYENATISGSGTSVGAFIGNVGAVPDEISKCIAWNSSLSFSGGGSDASAVITNCYLGTSGTISSQATTLGWDASVWDLSGSVPTLK